LNSIFIFLLNHPYHICLQVRILTNQVVKSVNLTSPFRSIINLHVPGIRVRCCKNFSACFFISTTFTKISVTSFYLPLVSNNVSLFSSSIRLISIFKIQILNLLILVKIVIYEVFFFIVSIFKIVITICNLVCPLESNFQSILLNLLIVIIHRAVTIGLLNCF
jgi:hypothetical protein